MKIEKLNEEKRTLWKKYIDRNTKTRIQHTLKFLEVVKNTYKNCKEEYFLSINNGKVNAIFPFFLIKSKIFGNRFISLPFLDVGGFFGKYNSKDIKHIIKKIKKHKEKIKYIEVRLNDSFENFKNIKKILLENNFIGEKSKQQFIVSLTSEEDMWKRFHKHTRNDIRKAQKSELVLKDIDNKSEIKRFYNLYSKEMKEFGSTQHSFKFFKNIFRLMKEKVIGFNCYKDQKIIGSLIMLYHNRFGYIAFNVSDKKYRNFRPNDLLYWDAMKWAINHNLKHIDLGQVEKEASKQSPAEGLYKFKRKWLGKLYDRIYFYYRFDKKEERAQEKKDKLKKFRTSWKKLPLSITKKLGPKIISELGI